MKNKILVLCSPSSCGKDYALNYLVSSHNYKPLISHTTRPIRPNEKNGRKYWHISMDEFQNSINN